MTPLFTVMGGGALGAGLRYLVGVALPTRAAWPWATLSVNLIGGFAMGLLAAAVLRGSASESFRLFAGVGILGGFTTFSAFSLESFRMIENGAWGLLLCYVLASVIGAVGALALGYGMIRS
ncbi:MAG: hypothetical protein RIS52_139 [Pseudomonadota bacterium]|jgi:fluoride exporter